MNLLSLIPSGAWVYLAIGALSAAFAGGWHLGGLGPERALAEYQREVARATASAQQQQRQIEAQRDRDITEIATNAQTQINALAAERDAAVSAADRLRSAASSAARRARANPKPADSGKGEPREDALDLLTNVLARHSSELVELGEFADRLRISGLACEASYDALSLDGAARVQVPLRR